MYHPYFRGKQYELITVRETAAMLAKSGFVPIIEPVKEALSGLERTLKAICETNGRAVVVVNPHHGDHSSDGLNISSLLRHFIGNPAINAGILLKGSMTIENVIDCYESHRKHPVTLIHAGFTKAKELAESLGNNLENTRNVFFEAHCGKLYRKHFQRGERILLRDGFQRRLNREHPALESFSDLHVTFKEEGMDGFGDFLIVGDDFKESGGPAYAVAIHLTFIDPARDDEMLIHHFVSDRQDTPTDPAGKFAEALKKMIRKLSERDSKVLETEAVREFRDLHAKRHFPGLGYVKKLSMKHHIETLAAYFS